MLDVKPMQEQTSNREIIEAGEINFSIESRILRELGERLVKTPEVALLELIKNAYDADASECIVDATKPRLLTVSDNGHGMAISQFRESWMRVGTSSKLKIQKSPQFGRSITGEKGIGRFAVRFLGKKLRLISVAYDKELGKRTKLTVNFNWPSVDGSTDLDKVSVPFELETPNPQEPLGTRLEISALRIDGFDTIAWHQVRTGAIGVISPLQPLLESTATKFTSETKDSYTNDPGFKLLIQDGSTAETESDLAAQILDNFVLRSTLDVSDKKIIIQIFENGSDEVFEKIEDECPDTIGPICADLRFFPRRPGTFSNTPIDGRRAYGWIKENSGVAVFDRGFRVLPYGNENDDWLQLSADTAQNMREPRSWIAKKLFPMSTPEKRSTSENWMLRLPSSAQMVGLVRVQGQRDNSQRNFGLIAAADREGFIENKSFKQLYQLVRGAIEIIAVVDRQIQRRNEKHQQLMSIKQTRTETRVAIEEVKNLPSLDATQKSRIISMLIDSQKRIESQEKISSQREEQLQIMSLLGVIAGYMTHEFGVALTDLETTQNELESLAQKHGSLKDSALTLSKRITRLKDFSAYVHAYIEGVRKQPNTKFAVKPRIKQIVRLLGGYARERGIKVEISVESSLENPHVPVTLYNGILQNLFTNAMKAVSARRGTEKMVIAFRAWNDRKWHYLQVSDTGIGIPELLEKLVFDPLFTTTDMNADPIGSGMGLGLSLVRRGVESFGGKIDLVSAPPGFVTCMQVRLPLSIQGDKT